MILRGAGAAVWLVVAACSVNDQPVLPLADASNPAMGGDARNVPPPPDAAVIEAMGLGKPCDPNDPCPAFAPTCIMLMPNTGYCAPSCGTTTVMAPPPDGDTMCKSAAPPSPAGTPACVVYSMTPDPPTTYQWYCGLLCGTMNGMIFGSCPGGLTCSQNICM